MKLIVNAHKIELIPEEPVNEKEINISKCKFEFSDEYGDNLVKEAYFTLEGETYKQIIVNDECSYPPEVLVKIGTVELGVVAYEVQDEEYIERFNPSPVYFQTTIGSLKDHAENSEEITPSEMEQFEQALEEGLAEVANVDIDASKSGNTATVSITNRNGVTKTVEIYDGEKGEDGEPGITPNIQVGTTTTLPAGSNATVTQRGTTENPIFDFGIPKGQDGQSGGVSDYTELSNKPKINNVELVGNKTTSDLGIVIPDISTKQDKITTTNKLSSDLVDDTDKTNKFVTASDKTTWNGKQDALVSGTNIKTINNTSLLGDGNITINEGLNAKVYYIDKNATTQELANYFTQWLSDYKNNINDIIYIYSSYSMGICDLVFTYNEGNGKIKLRTSYINNNSDVINYGTRYKNYGFYAKEATITNDTITNQTGWYADNAGYVPQTYNFLSTTNTSEFNPTVNSYNPATAKYAEKMVESVAPVYSSSSTYAVGDFVSYQGKLYKCSTAIATAEAWNSSHWTETQVVNELGGGGSSTPKYYIDGDYAIYNVSPGNYNITNPSSGWANVNNLPSTEMNEALTYAYSNNKYLVLNIPTTSIPQVVSFIGNTKMAYGIGLGLSLYGTLISNRGDLLAVTLNVVYSSTQTTATYDQAKLKYTSTYAIGTTNTIAYTPAGDYNPATKKYVDDAVGDIETILTALTTGNGVQ